MMEEIAIPLSLDEGIKWLVSTMSDDDRAYILGIDNAEEFIGVSHFSHASGIRNNWGLWSGGPLKDWFKSQGITHADDMSNVIFEALWYKIHKREYDIKKAKEKFDAHWLQYGDLGDV
jgi:hypothetical protein